VHKDVALYTKTEVFVSTSCCTSTLQSSSPYYPIISVTDIGIHRKFTQRVLEANTSSTSSYTRPARFGQSALPLPLAFNLQIRTRSNKLLDTRTMSNNMFGSMPGMQAFEDFYSGSQFFQDDLSGLDNSWIDSIDPELRVQNQPQAPLSWQVQHQFQQQNQLQQPMQRFIQEPERTFFSAAPLSIQSQGFFNPISTLPRVSQNRMGSPSPSQGALTSTCSSALSPPAENDWSQDNIFSPQIQQEELQPMSQFSHSHPDLWFEQFQPQGCRSTDPTVQLSQIQGFSDMAPEVCYDADEGYDEMAMKTEYTADIDNRMFKAEGGHSSYRYPSDEGLGASIKDEGSPQNSTIHVDHDTFSDADADADAEGDIDGDVIVAEEPSDTEYTPKSTRTRKRVASNTKTFSTPSKRARPSKAASSKASKNGGQFQCKSCDHAPFKDAAALQRHNASAHTRAFICVFAFAGCNSTFASKNEWKRHVSSQHLNLSAWVCELQGCSKVLSTPKTGGPAVKGSEFNRKDLFTQHLRRMHAPFAVKRMQKKNPEWEERLKELAVSCLRVKRQAPARLMCPVQGCGTVFEGQSCWDDRMEHVGKHLEKAAGMKGVEVRQENDGLLVQWALREGIVEPRTGGNGYKLCAAGRESRVDDEDAEGEEE
jgi:hypothetical protein